MTYRNTADDFTNHETNESSSMEPQNTIETLEEKYTNQSGNKRKNRNKPQQMYDSETDQQFRTIDLEDPYTCSSPLEDRTYIQNQFNKFSNTCREKILWSRRTTIICVMVAISVSLLVALYPLPQSHENPLIVAPTNQSREDAEDEGKINVRVFFNASSLLSNNQDTPANNTEPDMTVERTGMPKLFRNSTKTNNEDEDDIEDKTYVDEIDQQTETENINEDDFETVLESDSKDESEFDGHYI